MNYVLSKNGRAQGDGNVGGEGGSDSDAVVRLRGLPYQCTLEDITRFFEGQYTIQITFISKCIVYRFLN